MVACPPPPKFVLLVRDSLEGEGLVRFPKFEIWIPVFSKCTFTGYAKKIKIVMFFLAKFSPVAMKTKKSDGHI